MIQLSIVIVSLTERGALLSRLLGQLYKQPRINECEVIVIIDGGQERIGVKRNRAVDDAMGQYICHIDDDDEIADDYIERILTAIDQNPGIDVVTVRGRCTSPGFTPVEFDYQLNAHEGSWTNSAQGVPTIWRSPGHVCAIRTSLARAVAFPTGLIRGEDLEWSAKLVPLLKTAVQASIEPLYLYRLDPNKAASIPQMKASPIFTPQLPHESIFAPQYVDRSGPGSELAYAQPYRSFLIRFIVEHKIDSLIDLGCGDMTIMSSVMGTKFPSGPVVHDAIFVDVIAERIRRNHARHPELHFVHADIRTFPLGADLIICKDVLQHWSTSEVQAFLARLAAHRDHFRFALITNCNYGTTVNMDINTGGWRALDLTKPPFELGEVVFQWGDDRGGYKDVVLIKGRG